MSKQAEYIFRTPTSDLTYLAQLQEWADFYSVKLTWADIDVQTDGKTLWSSHPIIQGHSYASFVGQGTSLRAARQVAAGLIVKSPGTLNIAKTLSLPPVISKTR
ncbi:unnamed protein product [Rhizoctonia solani]|uniref:DRBM domain-containing protein n=1 Tax=Rhizoctonia solani TaxID=456999 RepID=A0A8H3APH4_9AGAM|nr:unnamed protein product [Rhizoctonia solani]